MEEWGRKKDLRNSGNVNREKSEFNMTTTNKKTSHIFGHLPGICVFQAGTGQI